MEVPYRTGVFLTYQLRPIGHCIILYILYYIILYRTICPQRLLLKPQLLLTSQILTSYLFSRFLGPVCCVVAGRKREDIAAPVVICYCRYLLLPFYLQWTVLGFLSILLVHLFALSNLHQLLPPWLGTHPPPFQLSEFLPPNPSVTVIPYRRNRHPWSPVLRLLFVYLQFLWELSGKREASCAAFCG